MLFELELGLYKISKIKIRISNYQIINQIVSFSKLLSGVIKILKFDSIKLKTINVIFITIQKCICTNAATLRISGQQHLL